MRQSRPRSCVDEEMTRVEAHAGACGFKTTVTARKEGRREVSIELESPCEAVRALSAELKRVGPLGIRDVVGKGVENNRVFGAGSKTVSHAGCPVLVAIIKAAEVEMGMNVPSPVLITFEPDTGR